MLLAGGPSNAGPIGLLVVILLGVATVLLIRNMDKRVKKLPAQFPEPAEFAKPAETRQPPDSTGPAGPPAAS